jgi:hypothetical protein
LEFSSFWTRSNENNNCKHFGFFVELIRANSNSGLKNSFISSNLLEIDCNSKKIIGNFKIKFIDKEIILNNKS